MMVYRAACAELGVNVDQAGGQVRALQVGGWGWLGAGRVLGSQGPGLSQQRRSAGAQWRPSSGWCSITTYCSVVMTGCGVLLVVRCCDHVVSSGLQGLIVCVWLSLSKHIC